MRFGNKNMSESIYKSMKNRDPEHKEGSTNVEKVVKEKVISERVDPTLDIGNQITDEFSPNAFSPEGGAFASLQNKKKSENEPEKSMSSNPQIESSNVVIRKKVDINLFEDFLIKSVRSSYDQQDYYSTVNSLYNLFISGSLESYSIKGIDKERILNVIEEFKEALGESLT